MVPPYGLVDNKYRGGAIDSNLRGDADRCMHAFTMIKSLTVKERSLIAQRWDDTGEDVDGHVAAHIMKPRQPCRQQTKKTQ